MRKKVFINPNLERLFSFIFFILMIIIINFVLTKTVLKKIQKASEDQLIDKCAHYTDDYSDEIEKKLEEIKVMLDPYYAKVAYKNLPMEKLRDNLIEPSKKLPPLFEEIFMVDRNGNGYNTTTPRKNSADRDYFKDVISGHYRFYISDMLYSKQTDKPVLILARPIYDYSNEIIGVLCAVCPYQKILEIFSEIHVKGNFGNRITIRDSSGRFILHPLKEWNQKIYDTSTLIKTPYDTHGDVDGIRKIIDVNGNPIILFYKNVENTDWIVSYSLRYADFTKVRRTQLKYHRGIMLFLFLGIMIVFLIDTFIHSFLENRQLLTTRIDSVTHLWVREYFEHEAAKMLKRNPDSKFMVIHSDIKGFKFLNQKLGLQKGDEILVQFANSIFAKTDPYNRIMCRGYADHFYSLIKIQSVHKAMTVLHKHTDILEKRIASQEIQYMPRFGVAFRIPDKKSGSSETIQSLIAKAEFATSQIKDNALQTISIYDSKAQKQSTEENYIESHMQDALANGEFFVVYQPKIDLKSEKIVGAEALVRWNNQELGFMPPNKFIPIFERNNFIVKLDFYVYEQVCKFLRHCLDEGLPVVPVSVNMSRNHNKPDRFVHDFAALVKSYDIPPSLIEVELLERSSMDKNILRDITVLLHEHGFSVAMDDFGSGESSLNMLSMIPVDILKFDRSFLYENNVPLKLDDKIANFITTLIELGKNLKKQTIFEGVETEEQINFLRNIKCDIVQGYFYSRPLNAENYVDFVKAHK